MAEVTNVTIFTVFTAHIKTFDHIYHKVAVFFSETKMLSQSINKFISQYKNFLKSSEW